MSQLRQYFYLFRQYWFSKESAFSWLLVISSFGFGWLYVYASIHMNHFHGAMINFVEARNKEEVFANFSLYCFAVVAFLFCYGFKRLTIAWAVFRWRQSFTRDAIGSWLENKNHCFLKGTDNPDQRISEDIQSFCRQSLECSLIFFTEISSLVAFMGLLWDFSFPLEFTLFDQHFSIPHYLAIGCLTYAVLVNFLLFRLGKPMVGLDYTHEQREADLRHALLRVKMHSEEIAFNQGESFEKRVFKSKFDAIRLNYYQLIKRSFYLDIFKDGYTAALVTIPSLAVLPLYFENSIGFGSFIQITSACASVLGALGMLISNFSSLASLQAAKNRLFQLLQSLPHKPQSVEGDFISINKGEKVLILGRSGSGKTSIFRSTAELPSPFTKKLQLPAGELFFVPQRPYLPMGTLQECLSYPKETVASNDDVLLAETLKAVHLEHLIPLLDEEKDFLTILSPGELQRLNMARVLLHKPNIVLMDEPTSSLDEATEQSLFHLLMQNLPTATIVTISHSWALQSFHDRSIFIESVHQPVASAILVSSSSSSSVSSSSLFL